MDNLLNDVLLEISVEDLEVAQVATTEVLRQYEEDPARSGNLVMMAFN